MTKHVGFGGVRAKDPVLASKLNGISVGTSTFHIGTPQAPLLQPSALPTPCLPHLDRNWRHPLRGHYMLNELPRSSFALCSIHY
jgi:hypothetical protein